MSCDDIETITNKINDIHKNAISNFTRANLKLIYNMIENSVKQASRLKFKIKSKTAKWTTIIQKYGANLITNIDNKMCNRQRRG